MINQVILMGNIGQRPELKTTQSGTAVTSFGLAVQRNFAKQGEERQTDWINIVAWKHTAEFICRYFEKGSRIAIVGRIQSRKYRDTNGYDRTVIEVVADEAHFCDSKGGGNAAKPAGDDMGNGYGNAGAEDFREIPCEDDFPF